MPVPPLPGPSTYQGFPSPSRTRKGSGGLGRRSPCAFRARVTELEFEDGCGVTGGGGKVHPLQPYLTRVVRGDSEVDFCVCIFISNYVIICTFQF
jgi:hypothetical protein